VGMKGSLQELGDGHWRLRVFPGREGGKVRQVSRNFKGTKRQAESALATLVADVERQQVAIGYAGTLGELIERWLDDIAAHRSAYTKKTDTVLAMAVALAAITGARRGSFARSGGAMSTRREGHSPLPGP
jgi:hypothetical protein